jgi:hypothetical protein
MSSLKIRMYPVLFAVVGIVAATGGTWRTW